MRASLVTDLQWKCRQTRAGAWHPAGPQAPYERCQGADRLGARQFNYDMPSLNPSLVLHGFGALRQTFQISERAFAQGTWGQNVEGPGG